MILQKFRGNSTKKVNTVGILGKFLTFVTWVEQKQQQDIIKTILDFQNFQKSNRFDVYWIQTVKQTETQAKYYI